MVLIASAGPSAADRRRKAVTKAALYTYMPSKEELLYYCHDSAMDTAVEIVEAAQQRGGTELQKLTSALRSYLEMMLNGEGSIVPCNPKFAIFMVTGALNWSRKWYRPDGNWSGPQIAYALTQMLERSLSRSPSDEMLDDPALFDPMMDEEALMAAVVEPKKQKKVDAGRRSWPTANCPLAASAGFASFLYHDPQHFKHLLSGWK